MKRAKSLWCGLLLVPPAAFAAADVSYAEHVATHLHRAPHAFFWYALAGAVTGAWWARRAADQGFRAMISVFLIWFGSVALAAAILLTLDVVLVLGPGVSVLLLLGVFVSAYFGLSRLSVAWFPSFPLDTHGSAAWATVKAIAASGRIHLTGQVPADGHGFALGRVPKAPARYDPRVRFMGHMLTCAPTGAGKGVGAVIPALLEYPGSCLVMDIKGENYAVTARARRAMGHQVWLIDPFGVTGQPAHAFNWLADIDPNHPDTIGEAAALAEMLVIPPAGNSGDTHFDDTARDLLRGLLLHIAGLEDSTLCTMGELRRRLGLPLVVDDETSECLADTLGAMQDNPDRASGVPFRAANAFMGTAERERSSILSTVRRHTAFLDDPRIVASLSRSDFRLTDLKRRPMTVYVVMPPARLSANVRFLRGFVGLALSAITATAEKPKHRVLFLLDEFGQLGRMQMVEDAISLVRGYGAAFWLFVQDLSQLKGVYPRWQTFLANAGQQFFGTADLDTARYISERLGKETIDYRTSSDSHSKDLAPKSAGSDSSSQHLAGRSLLNPDEVMGLQRGVEIVLIAGEPPYFLKSLSYLVDPEYQGAFDRNPYQG